MSMDTAAAIADALVADGEEGVLAPAPPGILCFPPAGRNMCLRHLVC